MEITDLNKLNIPFYDNEEQLLKWAKEHYGNKLSKAIKEHLTVEMNTEFQRKMEYATGDERQKLIETAYDIAFGDLEREVKRCTDAHKGIEGSFISTEVNNAKICLRSKYYPLYNDVMREFETKYPKFVEFLNNRDESLRPKKIDSLGSCNLEDYLIKGHDFSPENIAYGIMFSPIVCGEPKITHDIIRDPILESCKLYEEYLSVDAERRLRFLFDNYKNTLFIKLVAFMSTLENVDALDVYEIGSSLASWFEMARDAMDKGVELGINPKNIEFVIVSSSGEVLE